MGSSPVRDQTPSTGLRHPSLGSYLLTLEEGAGERCSESTGRDRKKKNEGVGFFLLLQFVQTRQCLSHLRVHSAHAQRVAQGKDPIMREKALQPVV